MGRPGQPRVAEERLPQEGVVIHCPYRPPKPTGVISDDMCRQKHMMPGDRDAGCARACVKAGVKYALLIGERVYVLKGDPKQIEGFAG